MKLLFLKLLETGVSSTRLEILAGDFFKIDFPGVDFSADGGYLLGGDKILCFENTTLLGEKVTLLGEKVTLFGVENN